MRDDYSYFRWRELFKSAMMTETAVLLPIDTRVNYELSEFLVVVFLDLRKSQTLLFIIKCINYNSPRVGVWNPHGGIIHRPPCWLLKMINCDNVHIIY